MNEKTQHETFSAQLDSLIKEYGAIAFSLGELNSGDSDEYESMQNKKNLAASQIKDFVLTTVIVGEMDDLHNAKKAAADWKARYEGMAILHSNKCRMIENGDLVYSTDSKSMMKRLDIQRDEQ